MAPAFFHIKFILDYLVYMCVCENEREFVGNFFNFIFFKNKIEFVCPQLNDFKYC